AELPANQATAGNEHRQFVAQADQVHRPFIRPVFEIAFHFLMDEADIGAQTAFVQGGDDQVELFAHALIAGGIGDVFTEDGNSELVSRAGAERVARSAEESLVGPGPGEDSDAASRQKKRKNVAEAAPATLQETHRIAVERQRVTDQRQTAPKFGRKG